MELNFSKEIISEYNLTGYGILNQCRLYKVYKDNFLLGNFFCADEVALFAYEENKKDFKIEILRKLWKQSAYTIYNQKDNLQVGHYDINSFDNNHNVVGILCIEKQIYNSKPLTPEMPENLNFFSSAARGHFKLKVFSEYEDVVYSIKINLPSIYTGREDLLPGNGKIQMSSDNLFLMFSGLFLLEEFLWHGSKRGFFDSK